MKEVPIEDWDQVPRSKIAFRDNFVIGSAFYRFQHLGKCRNQILSFLCHLRFPFYEGGPYKRTGTKYPGLK